jgi:hypothetical protein
MAPDSRCIDGHQKSRWYLCTLKALSFFILRREHRKHQVFQVPDDAAVYLETAQSPKTLCYSAEYHDVDHSSDIHKLNEVLETFENGSSPSLHRQISKVPVVSTYSQSLQLLPFSEENIENIRYFKYWTMPQYTLK